MEVWIASFNSGKVSEFKSILMGKGIQVKSASDLPHYFSPKETGETFKDNALIKAKALRSRIKDHWVIAEDSGLEVEGLNNLPGIHSARYAGPKATDHENVSKLLKMMSIRSATNRNAQFKCCLIAISPDGTEHVFEGLCKGSISKKVAGSKGFGYDPCFIPEGEEKTFAELGVPFKNKISHRSQAIRELAKLLVE